MTADLETRVRMLEAEVKEHRSLTQERFAQGNTAFAAVRESIGQLSAVVNPVIEEISLLAPDLAAASPARPVV